MNLGVAVRAGYKQTEVGVIPLDWEVRPLGDAIFQRPRYGIGAAAVPYSDRLPAYVRITDITVDGRFSPAALVSVDSAESSAYFLGEGDIVFARTGASVGKSYLYKEADGPLVFAGFLVQVRPNPQKVLPAFLAAYVTTRTYWNWVRVMSMRSGQPGVNGNEYSQLPVPLPGLAEQRAIVDALSDIDALLAKLDALIAKKRDLKQAAMQQLLSGQIRLPGFSGEWKMKQLDEIGEWKGGMTPSMQNRHYWLSGSVPWISSGDVKTALLTVTGSLITPWAVRQGAATLVPRNSVVVVTRSGILRKHFPVAMNLVPMAINQDVKALLPASGYSPMFLLYALIGAGNRILSRCMKAGTTVESVDFRWLKAFTIQIPSLREQTAIASVLSDMDAELSALEARRDKTHALKQGMMQELLTGRVRLV